MDLKQQKWSIAKCNFKEKLHCIYKNVWIFYKVLEMFYITFVFLKHMQNVNISCFYCRCQTKLQHLWDMMLSKAAYLIKNTVKTEILWNITTI